MAEEEESAPFLTDTQIIVFSLLLGIWIFLVIALIIYFKCFSPLAKHRRKKSKQSAATMVTLDSKEMVSKANEPVKLKTASQTQQSSDNVYEVIGNPHLIDIEAARAQIARSSAENDQFQPQPQQQKQDPGKNYETLGPDNLPPPPQTAVAPSMPNKHGYEYVQMGDLSRRNLQPPPQSKTPVRHQEQPSTSEDKKTEFEQTSTSEKKSISEKKKVASPTKKPMLTAVEKQIKPSEFHFHADKRTATTQNPSKESTRKKKTSATQQEGGATVAAENQTQETKNFSKEAAIPGVKMGDETLEKNGGGTTGGETEDVAAAAAGGAAQPVVIKAKKRAKSYRSVGGGGNGSSEKL